MSERAGPEPASPRPLADRGTSRQDREPMSRCTHRLECRASLLALAIATAGASVHVAALVIAGDDDSRTRVTCPTKAGRLASGPTGDPAYLEAVELRCGMAGVDRCDVANVLGRSEALERAEALLGPETADHAFVRFAPEYGRIVWSVRDLDAGTRAELDAFDGRVLEYSLELTPEAR